MSTTADLTETNSGQSVEVEIGIEESLESFLPPEEMVIIQLYLLPSLPPLKKPPNSIAITFIRKWNWNGESHESCPNPPAWKLV